LEKAGLAWLASLYLQLPLSSRDVFVSITLNPVLSTPRLDVSAKKTRIVARRLRLMPEEACRCGWTMQRGLTRQSWERAIFWRQPRRYRLPQPNCGGEQEKVGWGKRVSSKRKCVCVQGLPTGPLFAMSSPVQSTRVCVWPFREGVCLSAVCASVVCLVCTTQHIELSGNSQTQSQFRAQSPSTADVTTPKCPQKGIGSPRCRLAAQWTKTRERRKKESLIS